VSRLDIDQLYRRYGAMVQRRAREILGDTHAAGDAMQEVFIRAMRHGEGFRGDERSPVSWLYRITTNLCLNTIRDRARRAQLLAANMPAQEDSGQPTPEEQMATWQLLQRLPEGLREIAIYYLVDQMNRDEIAALLDVSPRTVSNRIVELRALLKAAIEDEQGAAP
jgi:RNA polymerase sigma-70 factor (ECF subfamily)